MTELDGYGRCNVCGQALEEDADVARAFSGLRPYQHARAQDCRAGEQPDPVEVVRLLWKAFSSGGIAEALRYADEDVEWVPSVAGGEVLRGHDALIAWMREAAAAGRRLEAHPYSFDRRGDCVLVSGFLRVHDRGTIQERHMHWVYRFDEQGVLRRAESYTSREAALAAVAGVAT